MTCLDHEHSASVEQAAHWLAQQKEPNPHPVIPSLRQRFDLTVQEACEAIALARTFRVNRRVFG